MKITTISVTSKWMVLVGALLLGLVAINAYAALSYTTRIEIIENDRTTVEIERITLDGDRARIEYFEGEHESASPKVLLLTTDGGKTWVLSEGSHTECGEWNMEAFYRNAGSLVTKAENWVNAKITEARVEKPISEPGPEILGYPTTHMRLHSILHAKARFLFRKFEYHVEITDDVWFAPDIELHPIEKRMLDAMAHTGYEKLDRMTQTAIEEIGGTVLKQQTVAHLRDVRKNKDEKMIQNFTVTSIERMASSDVPQEIFEMLKCTPVDKGRMNDRAKKVFQGLGFVK